MTSFSTEKYCEKIGRFVFRIWYFHFKFYRLFNIYEIDGIFFVQAINWHVIVQQLSVNLPEFTQLVQLINWQNLGKFTLKDGQFPEQSIVMICLNWWNNNSLLWSRRRAMLCRSEGLWINPWSGLYNFLAKLPCLESAVILYSIVCFQHRWVH
jgi:hypothetical protein